MKLPLTSFVEVLQFMFASQWTKGTCVRNEREDADVGTLAHLPLGVKRKLFASLYETCADEIGSGEPGCFDLSALIAPLQNAVRGVSSPDDLALLYKTRRKFSGMARIYLSDLRKNFGKKETALKLRKQKQLSALRAFLPAGFPVLGSAEPCIRTQSCKAQNLGSVQKRIESVACELTTYGEHTAWFAGKNASHRPESILCVVEGSAVRERLSHAYGLDETTVGETLCNENRAMVVLLRVLVGDTLHASDECLKIYYSGMHHVACSANTLVAVWSLVAVPSYYQDMKDKADRVVEDPNQDADDPDFATFMCAEKRVGFDHGTKNLCISCATTLQTHMELANKPNKKRKRKKPT